MASDLAKPDGLYIIPLKAWKRKLLHEIVPVRKLWGRSCAGEIVQSV